MPISKTNKISLVGQGIFDFKLFIKKKVIKAKRISTMTIRSIKLSITETLLIFLIYNSIQNVVNQQSI